MGIIINGQNDTIGPVDNSMSLLGTVSVGGTMTIEDFTNIDSVGLITARNGLRVTGGNVGINKASPSRYLEIGGTSNNPQIRLSNVSGTSSLEVLGNAASGQEIRFGTEASPQAGRIIYHNNDDSLSYSNTGGEKFRVTSAGEVRQQSTGGSTIYELKRSDANTTGSVGTINYTASDGHSVASMSAIGDGDNEGAHLVFRTTSAAANNSPYNAATPERLRITSSGSVAIGVNSPSDKLHVGGNDAFIRVDRPNGRPGLTLIYNSTNSTRADIDVTTGGDLRFATNNSTERLRIGSDGHLSYKNSSPPAWSTDSGYANVTLGSSAYFRTDTDVNSNFFTLGSNAYRGSSNWQYVNSGWATQLQQSAHNGDLYYSSSSTSGSADGTITWVEHFRVTSAGNFGIGDYPGTGDGATYNNWDIPKLHVRGSSNSGKFHLLGRFRAGSDADSTGAQIVIHHENDRGMALQGGRSSGNRSYGAIKSLDNLARESNVMVFQGGSGQGVENIKFYTNGSSTGTNERMSINTHGTVHTGGSTEITQSSLTPDLITQAGCVSPLFYRPFGGMSGAPSTSGPGYVDLGTGGVRHNLTDPHLGASYGGSQFQGGLIGSYSQTFSNTASGTTREVMNWNRFRILFRGLCLSTSHSPPTVKFRYSTYHYSNGWQDHSGTEWSFSGTEQARGGRWAVGPWINPSSYFTSWSDVPGFALYYNDNSSGKTFRIAGGVYFQYAHFI